MATQKYIPLVITLVFGLLLTACQPAPTNGPDEPVTTPAPVQDPGNPAPATEGSISITVSGSIWNDQCEALPGTAPEPMPLGCVAGSLGEAQADGVRDANELALSGVMVQIGLGACPATGLDRLVTDENGIFSTVVSIPAGSSLCISVDAESAENTAILLAGKWTAPSISKGLLAGIEITASERNVEILGNDFGWDFQAVGLSSLFAVSGAEANCRSGPGTLYPSVKVVLAGEEYPIVGKNADQSWFVLDIGGGSTCWVSTVVGTTAGNLEGVSVVAAPPPPAPTQASSGEGGSSGSGGGLILYTATPPVISSCSLYHDKTSCQNHGCTWVFTNPPLPTGYCKP